MKNTNLLLTLGAALLLAPPTIAFAQTPWQTMADFQCDYSTAVDAFTKDAAGNLYAAVSTSDAEGRRHAQVRKSSDHGATWTVVEDTVSAVGCTTKFLSLGADAAGHLYAVGYAEGENGQERWIVKKSGQGDRSWSTVDDFAWSAGETTVAEGFASDAAGNLYVAGHADEAPGQTRPDRRRRWLARQSRDGGRSWSTIDDFTFSFSARAMAIVSTSQGLFVAGSGWNGKPESGERWLVRKGTDDGDGGFRWQIVDEYQMQEHGHQYDSRPRSLGVDGRGNLYAVGKSHAVIGDAVKSHWIVRRASSEGSNWTVVDTFQLGLGSFAAAACVAAGGGGGVYVVGQAVSNNSESHWLVRKSATGDAGSWSVSDDFGAVASARSTPKAAGQTRDAALGNIARRPFEICRGLAILSDSARVYAGGSASEGIGHAIVRKLELGHTSDLTAAKAP